MSKLRSWQTKGLIDQQLLSSVCDVVFTADYMRDAHGGVIYHHHEVVQGVTNLIGWSSTSNNHVTAQIVPAPVHRASY